MLTCGGARWTGPATGIEVHAVPARPSRSDVDPVLSALDGRRLVVCGTDADLAAVVLRLLRTEALASVRVGYVASARASAVAALWGLPLRSAAAEVALGGEPSPVPLLRDDAGGVLLGLGVLQPVHGVAYCDSELLLRGHASRLEVTPDAAHGLRARVVRRALLGARTRSVRGRALQLGCEPATVLRDGVPLAMPGDRWTWYRHTEGLRLAGAPG